jgi:hypothetical protein
MFCPKCATQNVDGASFCRSCGANVSLIPQAMSGELRPPPEKDDDTSGGTRRKRRSAPTLDAGIRQIAMGLAFAVVSIMIFRFSPGGFAWWYWMLIPAFMFVGKGISDIVHVRQAKAQAPMFAQPQMSAGTRPQSLPVARTGELMTPVPSVTEGTTRHLGAEAPTKHLEAMAGEEKVS